MSVSVFAHIGGDFAMLPGRQFPCDSEGRFVDGELAPGCDHYSLRVLGPRFGRPEVVDKIVVAPGQTIDLGDVKFNRRSSD
jgi:hypothetical protein